MSRLAKRMKKYERHILLGLVILLLTSFSVLGAVQCRNRQMEGPKKDFSGTFRATPTEEVDVSANDFIQAYNRYEPWFLNQGPSLRYDWRLATYGPTFTEYAPAWAHVVMSRAAEAAGYDCGPEYQLPLAIRKAISTRMDKLAYTNALYDTFLREYYHRSAADFQATIREIAEKDMFLSPLVESRRYSVSFEEAYESWKKQTEYVDLQFVALRGADFMLDARQLEDTRAVIQKQEDRLTELTNTIRAIQRLEQKLERWQNDNEGKRPETLEPLKLKEQDTQDAWGGAIVYTVEGDAYALVSPGPDGRAGTEDDVDRSAVKEMLSLEALRRVGDALERWKEKSGAWPESLAKLKEPPPSGDIAPLARDVVDGQGRPLAYQPPEGEGAPSLTALGPDGEAGTADDLAASFQGDRVLVGSGPRTGRAVDESLQDAWKHPLRVRLSDASAWLWDVVSAGADGVFGTDDDVLSGNASQLKAFYQQPSVKGDYRIPTTREFRAIYVELPLVPDEVMKRLWEAFPEYHPDEAETYREYRKNLETYYTEEDPADPETGHGAELARRLAPGKPATLVPSKDLFGEPPADLGGSDDPDLQRYLEKGWRPILLRQGFFEEMLNAQLQRARDSRAAHEKWVAAHAKAEAGEGEDETPEPAVLTFDTLIAGVFQPYLPGQADPPYLGYYETDHPMTVSEIEAIPSIGGQDLTAIGFQGLSEPGQFASIPTQLNNSLTKAILQNLAVEPAHDAPLEDVRDEVYERYLTKRALDLAGDALRKLSEGASAEQRSDADAWQKRLEEWGTSVDAPHVVDETGMFIGSEPPPEREVPDGTREEEARAIRRRDYVRQTGYESVRPYGASEDAGTTKGAFGHGILKDDSTGGTDSAYLVRVLDRQNPPPQAFSPAEYRRYVIQQLLGQDRGTREARKQEPKSPYIRAMYRYYSNIEWIQKAFSLETSIVLVKPPVESQPPERPGQPGPPARP